MSFRVWYECHIKIFSDNTIPQHNSDVRLGVVRSHSGPRALVQMTVNVLRSHNTHGLGPGRCLEQLPVERGEGEPGGNAVMSAYTYGVVR